MRSGLPKNEIILVTGSSGFIGRELCKCLRAEGYRFFEFDSENGGVCLADNLMALSENSISHVFHLAGRSFVPESWDNPATYFEVNTVGTQNVLEFCRRTGSSLTYISSYLYGEPEKLPIDENTAVQRTSPYANSKFLAEELCRFYAQEFDVRCTILRPFNIFGPGQDCRMLIPHIIEEVLNGTEIRVKDLMPRRDYLHVEDMVDVLLLTYPQNPGLSVYNVGSGESYSVQELIDIIQRIAGTSLGVTSSNEKRRNEILDVRADITLLRQKYKWQPRIKLEDGLRALIKYELRQRKLTPINKGNYSMEPPEREERFERLRGFGWEDEYKQYRREWFELPRLQKIRNYPLQVDLELSSTCNLSCPMCFTQTAVFKSSVQRCFMDDQLFKKIIDEIVGHVPSVRLSLRGEATLHPHFVELLSYAKSCGIPEVSFLTNGSTMTPELFEKIMHAGADWIIFSIDGLDSTYESIRRPMQFEKTLEMIRTINGIKRAHDHLKPVVKVQTLWPAIRTNPEKFYDTFSPYSDLVAFNPLIDYLSNDADIVFEEEFICSQLYQRVLIGADGKGLLCSNDEMCSESPGDANFQTIHEIWHGDKMTAIRNIHLCSRGFMDVPVCRHCYLPRKTEDSETASIHGRVFRIHNYVNRSQEIGK